MLELAIAIAILAVVAAIAVPRMSSMSANAKAAATQETVRRAQLVLDEQQAITGSYPASFKSEWFPSGAPVNALLPDQLVNLEIVSGPADMIDPTNKVAAARGAASFWYNSSNGSFRARIPPQGSAAANVAMYFKVNNLGAPRAGVEVVEVDGGGLSAQAE
ncbi:hypothetical protein PHYC_01658 [Phycisphaerales bacterium]|nr:hypothetical protein PHYC_01658 [Phycisphaerales bacterium]